jgi:hypothetical protein
MANASWSAPAFAKQALSFSGESIEAEFPKGWPRSHQPIEKGKQPTVPQSSYGMDHWTGLTPLPQATVIRLAWFCFSLTHLTEGLPRPSARRVRAAPLSTNRRQIGNRHHRAQGIKVQQRQRSAVSLTAGEGGVVALRHRAYTRWFREVKKPGVAKASFVASGAELSGRSLSIFDRSEFFRQGFGRNEGRVLLTWTAPRNTHRCPNGTRP